MHHSTHSIAYTTAISRGALDGTRNSSMGPPWRIDPTTHCTMSERSYHGATSRCWQLGFCLYAIQIFKTEGGLLTVIWYPSLVSIFWMLGRRIDPSFSYFSVQPMLHGWSNKDRGMYYPVCGMLRIKDPLPLIGKSSPCNGGSGFPILLCEWSFTICPMPYRRK